MKTNWEKLSNKPKALIMRNDPRPVYVNNEQTEVETWPFDIRDITLQTIDYLQLSVTLIDITLLSTTAIQAMNHAYFKVNTPTDTISFSLTPDAPITGDVYLCPSVIRKNAQTHNVSFSDEFKTVIIHSVLHLMGMNDDTNDAFLAMKKKQDHILSVLRS